MPISTEAKQIIEGSADTRESFAGFHFVSYYLEDPYGWYLRYVRGLRYRFTPSPLLMGRAIHTACEIAYTTYNRQDVIDGYKQIMRDLKQEYESFETWQNDIDDGVAMLQFWFDKWNEHDRQTYKVLAIEESYNVRLANGYMITIKPDLELETKDQSILVLDHKTSRRSMSLAHEYLENSGQSTCYLMGLTQQKYKGRNVMGIQSDVLYKNRSKVDAQRVGIITRNKRQFAEFQLNMIGLLSEMSQKVSALAEGYPVHLLFPRNQKNESMFSHDWPNIYMDLLPEDPAEPPFNYTIDTWTKDFADKALNTLISDPFDLEFDEENG